MRTADLPGAEPRSYFDAPPTRSDALSWFKKEKHAAARHENSDDAIARYLEELRQADVQGIAQPASALNGLGDAYLDKGDIHSAVDHYRQSAEAYAREGMYDNAIACCKKIRRYAPENDNVGLLLGRFYAAKGLRADAARELEAYAEVMERSGQPREAIAALADVVGLGLDNPLQRESLARLYAENGQRDAAVQEYRALRREYEARGDAQGVARITDRLAEHDDRPPQPSVPAPDRPEERKPVDPAAEEDPIRLAAEQSEQAPSPPPIPLGLEIEPTSYSDERPAEPDHAAPEPGEHTAKGGYAEMVSQAERAIAQGESQRAAEQLAEAGKGFTAQRRWEEAVDAYRRLADLGAAQDEHYGAWTEAARQLGMASLVLEALASQARWHVEGGRRSSARRAAEEMLLVDPQNEVATEILSKVGSSLPRD